MASKKTSRSLGSLRNSSEVFGGKPSLPPLLHPKSDFNEGIIVSSMSVPPQKMFINNKRSPNADVRPKVSSGLPNDSTDKSQTDWEKIAREKVKLIQEKEKNVKEKQQTILMKEQEIRYLQTENEELKSKLVQLTEQCASASEKMQHMDTECKRLQALLQIKTPSEDYKYLYEQEKSSHGKSRDQIALLQTKITDQDKKLAQITERHREEMLSLKGEMESKLDLLNRENNKEIAERDERINNLKKRMAEAFTGNSLERQQQIDELTKHLAKLQDESDNLRLKLKVASKEVSQPAQTVGKCQKCAHLSLQLEKSDKVLKEKGRALDELTLVCGRLEAQLKKQDELLKQWGDLKGRVLVFEK